MEINTPIAIGKSNIEPSFFVFAGDKFIIIFLLSKSKLEFLIAVFTLSLDSFTLVSGKPTISKHGIPGETSTSTFIK